MISLWLNTLLGLMAAIVSYRYSQLALGEPARSASRYVMIGIACSALGVLLLRLYWAPWYWLTAQGERINRSQAVMLFWSELLSFDLWGLYAGMVLAVVGLHMILHVSRNKGDHLRALRGLSVVCLIAAVAPLLAWVWS